MAQFVKGDTVVLKTGEQTMTVEKLEGSVVHCVWEIRGKFYKEKFNASSLKISDEKEISLAELLDF